MGCDSCYAGQKIYTSCPKKQITSEVLYVANLSDMFDNGVMPESGGLNDQDSKFVNNMLIMKNNESYFKKGD